jgi:receptor expression-enhancing protein 5/6
MRVTFAEDQNNLEMIPEGGKFSFVESLKNIKTKMCTITTDLENYLYEPGVFNDFLGFLEAKINMKRLHSLGFLVMLYFSALTFFSSWAQLFCNGIGFVYPLVVSMKAIESSSNGDYPHWWTYWVLFAFFTILEFFSTIIVYYFSLYWFAKTAILLYLCHPKTNGARQLYMMLIGTTASEVSPKGTTAERKKPRRTLDVVEAASLGMNEPGVKNE